MSKKNFSISQVATAPSPATTGTSLVVEAGHGTRFADDEPAVIFPAGEQPTPANAEIVMITNISTDTLTITREQESTSARTIVVGDIIMQPISAGDWNDLISSIPTDVDDLTDTGEIFIPSTDRSGDGDSVVTVDSADIEGEYLVKFDADGNITDSGLHSGNVLESIDEDNMASNLSTKVPTQQSVKAYVDNQTWSNGWIDANETWTYASADDPTYTFTISGDKTSKYSAGMRIKLTQTTAKYFIVTKVAYSSPNTTITVYGGTDYDLANATITSPYYSMVKAPQGFPLSPDKWTVETKYASSAAEQSSPTQSVWYNLGSISIDIPVGVWNVHYMGAPLFYIPSATFAGQVTLSTSSSSESDGEWTSQVLGYHRVEEAVYRSKVLTLTTKDTYYLLMLSKTASMTFMKWVAETTNVFIRATCAYL